MIDHRVIHLNCQKPWNFYDHLEADWAIMTKRFQLQNPYSFCRGAAFTKSFRVCRTVDPMVRPLRRLSMPEFIFLKCALL